MADALLVPIHLDALRVVHPTPVHEASVDFSKVPYSGHVNSAEAPYLGELIRSIPFENQQLLLEPGVHLHWSLPDGLTRAVDGVFPAVPNRWLISRRDADEHTKEWLVESDYVHPAGKDDAAASVAFPLPPVHADEPPFRFVGRTRTLPLPPADGGNNDEYLRTPLTAVGFGDPTFAALYANCCGIFGLHDDDAGPAIGLEYEVIGWYASDSIDALQQLRKPGLEDLQRALHERYGWVIENAASVPDRLVCYGRLKLEKPARLRSDDVAIAIGNTGVEALAALLGATIAPRHHTLIEQLYEVAQLGGRLDRKVADAAAKFEEAWHEKGFRAAGSGAVWSVVAQCASGAIADAEDAQARAALDLPSSFARQLDVVNRLQREHDRARDELYDLRAQLFGDWYRYLLSAYPPIEEEGELPDADRVRHFIEQHVLPRIDEQVAAVDGLSGRVTAAVAELTRLTDEFNARPDVRVAKVVYHVSQKSTPRYWAPNEPVVLIAGDPARPTDRHGFDGRLRADELLMCAVLEDYSGTPLDATQRVLIRSRLDALAARPGHQIGFEIDSDQPWNPLLLEWVVEFFPKRAQSSLYGADYAPDYITNNWELDNDAVDLRAVDAEFERGANVYRGASILTPHASVHLEEALAAEAARIVKPLLLEQFATFEGTAVAEVNERTILDRRERFNEWLTQQEPPLPLLPPVTAQSAHEQVDAWLRIAASSLSEWALLRNPAVARFITTEGTGAGTQLRTRVDEFFEWYQMELGNDEQLLRGARAEFFDLKDAAQLLALHAGLSQLANTPCLAQALSGFNDALLMQHQSAQLPVDDPFAFRTEVAFVQRVRQHVGRRNRNAPQPLHDFNPIRAGALKILRLRLVDTFGQVRDLSVSAVSAADTIDSPSPDYHALLPPRVLQPLRLNFRWLDADTGLGEMSDHAATSPICGWIVPNLLDASLMVYAADGSALGSLTPDDDAPWQPAPGTDRVFPTAAIDNRTLQRVVQSLEARQRSSIAAAETVTFLDRLLALMGDALLHIEPERTQQHQCVAVLMGQPIAVVRASIDLELQGLPAPHQGWSAFRLDLQRGQRYTREFENVKFPIRIGEHGQLNDGLVGYWIDDAFGTPDEKFYSPQSDVASDDYLSARDENPLHLAQPISAPPQTLTLLLDPRAVVHATCGIAPTKAIDIPPAHYTEALDRIAVTFLGAPLLSDQGVVRVSLPDEPGYEWSWLARENGGWRERGSTGLLLRADVAVKFGQAAPAIWQELKERGWITANTRDDQGIVVPVEQRTQRELGAEFANAEPRIEAVLAASRLTPFTPVAAFHARQELREGWFKLKPATQRKDA